METSGFFNSVNGDRLYQASDYANYFNSFITNGVFPNPSSNLQVLSNNNMTVNVSIGKGWINGYIYNNTSALTLAIAAADGVLNRIDRIVIRYDINNRTINSVVKKGTAASIPVAPTLQQDATYFELALADVYIGAGATSISQANITDQRTNSSLCGFVNSLIQADSTTLFAQYSSQFNDWFASIQGLLSGDVAGNLLNQINGLAGAGRTTETVKQNANNIAANAAIVTSHLADYVRQPGYAVATGSANTYAVTLSPAPTAYVDGMAITVKINVASTGTSTLNVNGLGAKSIKDSLGNAITSGGLKANTPYTLRYESTSGSFIVQGKGGGGNTIASHILAGETATVDSGPVVGTMPNRTFATNGNGYTNAASALGDNGGSLCVSPQTGYYLQEVNGSNFGPILAYDSNYVPVNIARGKTVFGVTGTCIPITAGEQILLNTYPTWAVSPLLTFGDSTMRKMLNGIQMNVAGDFRVKCDVTTAQYSGELHKYQFYRNGSPVGSLVTLSNSYGNGIPYTIAIDLTFNVGDVITLYTAVTWTSGSTGCYMQNFRICGGAPTNVTYGTSL